MIGYKAAISCNQRVVVTLEIPEDALTNIERKNVAVKEYAKHRCNKAKVLKIEDENGKEYEEAETDHYDKSKLTYKLNQTVYVHRFDTNLETVCSTGIHFFLTKRVAEIYGVTSIPNGFLQSWYENGQKYCECTFVDNKCDGLFTTWYDNGNKEEELTYVKGVKNGLHTKWYKNGNKKAEVVIENCKMNGLYSEWYSNGQKERERVYENNILNGPYKVWYENGKKKVECTYENGKKIGHHKEWNENGMLSKDINYIHVTQSQYEQCCVIS